jgi:23S rRNA (guanosine2251-2'-O)-methyltransferase
LKTSTFQIRLCENPSCGLRYPLVENHPYGERCPACFGATRLILTRTLDTEPWPSPNNIENPPLEAFLDNIRSAWNVGSIFRTADGYGLRHLHLCGITPTPTTADLSKTALGAEEIIPWTYHKNSVQAGETLKKDGYLLWALEQDYRAIPISDLELPYGSVSRNQGSILIIGNEKTGVDPDLLELCDEITYLPMRGNKRSFNVAVAFAIAIQSLLFLLRQNESTHQHLENKKADDHQKSVLSEILKKGYQTNDPEL